MSRSEKFIFDFLVEKDSEEGGLRGAEEGRGGLILKLFSFSGLLVEKDVEDRSINALIVYLEEKVEAN